MDEHGVLEMDEESMDYQTAIKLEVNKFRRGVFKVKPPKRDTRCLRRG